MIKPEVLIESRDWASILQGLEEKGRICYQSEAHDGSAAGFVRTLIRRNHLSVLEHVSVSVKFTVDRGVSHEIVRHRVGSYSQESTRYCNPGLRREITVIEPFFFEDAQRTVWLLACAQAEKAYCSLLKREVSPQEARSVLPSSLKTELWVTYNLREWRHFFELRAAKAAHPQMRQVAIPLLIQLQKLMPVVFDGIPFDTEFLAKNYAKVALT